MQNPFQQTAGGNLNDPLAFMTYITPGWLNGRVFSVPLTTQERIYVANVASIYRNRTAELFVPVDEETDNDEDDPDESASA